MKRLRLKNPVGMLWDPATGFTISGSETVPMPDCPGAQIRIWLIHGAIEEIDVVEEAEPVPQDNPASPEASESEPSGINVQVSDDLQSLAPKRHLKRVRNSRE